MEKIKEKERPAYGEWGKFCFVHAPAWVWGIAFLCCAAEIFVSYLSKSSPPKDSNGQMLHIVCSFLIYRKGDLFSLFVATC